MSNPNTILHPITAEARKKRDALLQASLRPVPAQIAIASEYPIVLSAERPELSLCLHIDGALSAHANLWPRDIVSQTGELVGRVGLVGNVATKSELRGRGVMRMLMEELTKRAQEQELDSIILWSDLISFYQKLGFQSLSKEWRITFARQELEAVTSPLQTAALGPCRDPQQLQWFLEHRYPVPLTVLRSPQEFAMQLSIPGTHVFVDLDNPANFGILGKGYDMMNVIHEWGAASPEQLLRLVMSIAKQTELAEATLLAPRQLDPTWLEVLSAHAIAVEEHEMALHLPLKQKAPNLDSLFVWGLDAI